jgi:hypothetical protein
MLHVWYQWSTPQQPYLTPRTCTDTRYVSPPFPAASAALLLLQAGGRLFDLDYAGGRFGVKFGHCMSCLCAFSEIESENDPNKVCVLWLWVCWLS